jgi:hypothetical protein
MNSHFYFVCVCMCRESENLPIELALLQIDTFKAKFLKTEVRTTEGYTMLKVVEYL